MEEYDDLIGINDANSNIIEKEPFFTKKKKLIILAACLLLVVLVIIIIIIVKTGNGEKEEPESQERPETPEFPGEIIGKIECRFDIDTTNDYTNLLSDQYIKSSVFDLQINGKSVRFSKNYKFSKTGANNVTFVLYENINMENMLKDISAVNTIYIN